jgi:hypothetical protein
MTILSQFHQQTMRLARRKTQDKKQRIADLSLSSSQNFHYSHDKDSQVIVVAASYSSQKFNFSGV